MIVPLGVICLQDGGSTLDSGEVIYSPKRHEINESGAMRTKFSDGAFAFPDIRLDYENDSLTSLQLHMQSKRGLANASLRRNTKR